MREIASTREFRYYPFRVTERVVVPLEPSQDNEGNNSSSDGQVFLFREQKGW